MPEDDANRQIANGFIKAISGKNVQILGEGGGWPVLLERFQSEYVTILEGNADTHVVLVIDFDEEEARLGRIHARIPGHLRDRVFVVGSRSNPEEIRKEIGSFETIGEGLAGDCREDRNDFWGHELLKHNLPEVQRFRQLLRSILFPAGRES